MKVSIAKNATKYKERYVSVIYFICYNEKKDNWKKQKK